MELFYQSYGAGFPLIILHGLFGSSDNWQPVAKKLGARFEVLTVDLRNHGRSPHSEEMNYTVMAEDVRELMARRGLPRAHLLGHSMGGKTAMTFALRHPTLVSKLVVVDMAAKEYPPVHEPLFDAMLGVDLSLFKERAEVDAALAEKIRDARTRQFLLKNVGRDETGKLRWKLNLGAIHRGYDRLRSALESAGSFNGDTLVVKGGRSEHVLVDDLDGMRKLFPRMRVEVLENAGHWVHADDAEGLAKVLEEFLGGS